MGRTQVNYKTLFAQIQKAIGRTGNPPWLKPWTVTNGGPMNLATGKAYQGLNKLWLPMISGEQFFIGATQGFRHGAKLRKGSKAVSGWHYKPGQLIKVENEQGELETRLTSGIMSSFLVHPLSSWVSLGKLENKLPQLEQQQKPIANRKALDIIDGYKMKPSISYMQNSAWYSPTLDSIGMPSRESFSSEPEFFSTLFHECVHSTGHSERLDRDLTKANMGTDSYSKEELIAEIGSMYLSSIAGINEKNSRQNSVSYLQAWLGRLEKDPTILVWASSAAEKAVNHILGNENS